MPEALLSYYFAAASNQTGAQMVLGYRYPLGLARLSAQNRVQSLLASRLPVQVMFSFVAGIQHLPAWQSRACTVKLRSSIALFLLCRHMYGIDVPKSCQAALLYYNPVAERVVEAARAPGQLPPVSTGVTALHVQLLLSPSLRKDAACAAQ